MQTTAEIQKPLLGGKMPLVADEFSDDAQIVLALGDSLDILRGLPTGFAKLIVSSVNYAQAF
jgi:hypothetical protein